MLLTYGEILLRQGIWDKAIEHYSEALFLAKKNCNKKIEAKSLMNLGFVFRGHRFLYLAIDHYREAERIYKEINNNAGLVEALYERANTNLSLKMTDQTLALISEIEKLILPDSPMSYFLLRLHVCIHNQKKEFQDALNKAEQLNKFFKAVNDKKGEAESMEMLGSAYYNLSQLDFALDCGNKGHQLAREIGDKLIEQQCMSLITDCENALKYNIDLDQIRKVV